METPKGRYSIGSTIKLMLTKLEIKRTMTQMTFDFDEKTPMDFFETHTKSTFLNRPIRHTVLH